MVQIAKYIGEDGQQGYTAGARYMVTLTMDKDWLRISSNPIHPPQAFPTMKSLLESWDFTVDESYWNFGGEEPCQEST